MLNISAAENKQYKTDKKKHWEYSQAIFCRNLNATKPVFVETLIVVRVCESCES